MTKRKLQFIAGEQAAQTPKQEELIKKGLLHVSVHHPRCKLINHRNRD